MFNRLPSKSPTYSTKSYQFNQTKKSTTHSYLQMHRLKKTMDSLDYEIIDHGGYFYQGSYYKVQKQRFKDGQGILITKRGLLIIGNWIKNNLSGRCIILTPFGGTINANFVDGKLQGWCIGSYLNKVIVCTLYYNDKIDGQKLIYQDKEKLWVASKYNREGQFQKIIHVEKANNENILPSFVEQAQLQFLLTSFRINLGYELLNSKRIKFMNVTKDISYIGYVDENEQPTGLGLLYGFQQHYAGHFSNGVLENYGRILFENGSIYHGQLINGQFHGVGCYYDPQKNCSCIVRSENNQIIHKQSEISGYIAIEVHTNLGKKSKLIQPQEQALRSRGLMQLCNFLEQYYVCYINQLLQNKLQDMSVNSQYSNQDHFGQVQSPKNKAGKIATPSAEKSTKKWFILNEAEGQSEQYELDQSDGFGLEKTVQKVGSIGNQKSEQLVVPQKLHKVYSLQKKDIGQKYDISNFQSIPIKEVQNDRQTEGFKKKLPKNQTMSFKKMPIQEAKSLDPGQITFRQKQTNQPVFQIKPIKVNQLSPNNQIMDSSSNNLSSIKSSDISNLSIKMADLIIPNSISSKGKSTPSKGKSKRNKIFQ